MDNGMVAILAMADTILSKVKDPSDDAEALTAVSDLSIMCYHEGAQESIRHNAGDMTSAVQIGFNIWKRIIEYAKDVYALEFHPLAMLFILRQAASYSDEERVENTDLQKAIAEVLKAELDNAEDELKEAEVVPVPEIEQYGEDLDSLIPVYFKLMEEIGTFHRDRSKYETEEKRQLHDKIVAIYHKISSKL